MKKFIIELFFLLAIIIFTSWFFYSLKEPWFVTKMTSISTKYEIINLGNSHGNSFDYSQSSLKGEKFNKPGNTLYYDLKNYFFLKPHLQKNAIIIIPISYYVFGLNENRKDFRNKNSFVNDYYSFLPPEQIYEYSKEKSRKLFFYRIQKNAFNLLSYKNKIIPKTNSKNLETNSIMRASIHKKLALSNPSEKNISYLSQLIIDAKKSGFRPVLVSVPYSVFYNEKFDKKWLDKNYYTKINRLSNKFNIPYMDYSHDIRFCSNVDYFKDSDHTSVMGRKEFSKVFFNELKTIKLNQN